MKFQFALARLYTTLAFMGLASASNLFRGDGADDVNVNIVGGIEAIIGRYPYTVAFISNGFQFCGGTLIAPDVVLTAAHCISGSLFNVVIGRHDLMTLSGEVIARKQALKHPNYNRFSMENDFAIVTLSRATSQNVKLVKLNNVTADPASGATSRTMGWGDTTDGGSASNVLREVDLPIIKNEECDQKYSGGIYESMICTFQPGKDSCQGDSGGPLIIPGSSADTDILIGVVSWGYGCATDQYPGVYARVSNGFDWIKSNVCSLSAFPPSDLCGSSTLTSKPTTKPPTNKPTTKPPTNKPTTKPPTNKPTAKPPTNKPTTNKPTTKPPTSYPSYPTWQITYTPTYFPTSA